MSTPATQFNFNGTTPAASEGSILAGFQTDGATPIKNISMTVPIATAAAPGVVQPDGVTVEVSGIGEISIPTATAAKLGLVQPDGATIQVSDAGIISVPKATTGALGVVIPDGTTITIADGVISAVSSGGGGDSGSAVLFGIGSPNGTAAALVQSAVGHQDTAATTVNIPFSEDVTSGNLLLLGFSSVNNFDAALAPSSVTDSLGTIYSLLVNDNPGGTYPNLLIYAGIAPASGPNTVALYGAGGYGQGLIGTGFAIMEVSGCSATVDASASSLSVGSLAITTTYANDFLFAVAAAGAGSQTWDAPFTLDAQTPFDSSADSLAIGHDIVSAGTYTLTLATGGAGGLGIVAFKTDAEPQSGSDGDVYFDTTSAPYVGYVYHSGIWNAFS